ncbi:hypothetical protein [Natrinema salinisoli]|uniref:hypothetical protein n=1 Tax=Natrinema salinisoli TaxID=2878535 RepID=UPI001CF000DB|nr:hypothetical protein [Natrinema salinisoli]
MYKIPKEMLYPIIGIPLLAFAARFLLVSGLAGGLGGLLALAGLVLIGQMALFGDDTTSPVRRNCSECGTRNEPDRERCKHCNVPIDADSDT